jgi:hypothetical protein
LNGYNYYYLKACSSFVQRHHHISTSVQTPSLPAQFCLFRQAVFGFFGVNSLLPPLNPSIPAKSRATMDSPQLTQTHEGWADLQAVLKSDQPVVIDGYSLTIAGVVAVAMYVPSSCKYL